MKKYFLSLAMGFAIFFVSLMFSEGAFALTGNLAGISSMSANGRCGSHWADDRQHFNVYLNWGSGCYGSDGSLLCYTDPTAFVCVSPGLSCGNTYSINYFDDWYWFSAGDYDYYEVGIFTYGGYQDVWGWYGRYNPQDTSITTNFKGSSWVTSKKLGSDNKATVSFEHAIERTDDYKGSIKSRTDYQVLTVYKKNNGSWDGVYYGRGDSNRKKGDSYYGVEETIEMYYNTSGGGEIKDSVTPDITLSPGDSVTICQLLWYDETSVKNNSGYSYSDWAYSASRHDYDSWACDTVTRDAEPTLRAYGVAYDSATNRVYWIDKSGKSSKKAVLFDSDTAIAGASHTVNNQDASLDSCFEFGAPDVKNSNSNKKVYWYTDTPNSWTDTDKNKANYVESITANKNVYAYYSLKSYVLTAKSVTQNGTSLASVSGLEDVTDNVSCKSSASVTHGNNDAYTFKGWRASRTSGTPENPGNKTYSQSSMSKNVTIYAVYEKKSYTLTVHFWGINSEGTGKSIKDGSGHTSAAKTIYHGDTAQYSAPGITGYDFVGWSPYGSGGPCAGFLKSGNNYLAYTANPPTCDSNEGVTGAGTKNKGYWLSGTNRVTYSYMNMTNDVGVTAVYRAKRAFSARASVAQGSDWNSSNRAKTEFTNSGGSVSIDVDCANEGCNVNYWLELRRDMGQLGGEQTAYRTSVTTGGSNPEWSKQVASSFGDNNVQLILGKSDTVGSPYTLKPGEGRCEHLSFHPYGEYSNDTWKQVMACAKAKLTTFEGQSNVTGVANGSYGFTNKSGTKVVEIANCSTTTGCNVQFNHRLKSSGSVGKTDYTIVRKSNLTSGVRSIADNNSLKTGTFSGSETEVYKSDTLTLYPGMLVCESVNFKPNNASSTTSNAVVKVCAYAKGNAQPPDPNNPDEPEDPNGGSNDSSFLNIKVRNNDVSKYSKYQRTVYAKPENRVTFRAVYNPTLQYTFRIRPDVMKIDNSSTLYPSSGDNTLMLGQLFNNSVSLKGWNNAFSVDSGNFSGATVGLPFVFTNGDISHQERTMAAYMVDRSDVGKTLDEKARTNVRNGSATEESDKTTPSQVIFSSTTINNSFRTVANVITTQKSSIAYVKVPYNYNTGISVSSNNDVLYSGEDGSIDVNIDVLPKKNNETTNGGDNEAYATKMPGAKVKLVVYAPGEGTVRTGDADYSGGENNLCGRYLGAMHCSEKSILTDETFNEDGNLAGGSEDPIKASFNEPDMDAGAEVCVAAAVYPANSGVDTNMDKSGNGHWNVSASKCFKIAKKPSLQVWGGGVYSDKKLSVPVSTKHNLDGYSNFSLANSGYYVFGSWAELNVVSNGEVKGFASGASTGYAFNDGSNLWPRYNVDNTDSNVNPDNVALLNTYGPGGSHEVSVNFCIRSVLTFANNGCTSGVSGGMGTSSKAVINNNRDSLIARFKNNQQEDDIDYSEINEDYTINENIIVPLGVTKVIKLSDDADLTINSNIDFLDSYSYHTIAEVPKLVLYARNIWINCGVERIDAVLIAKDDVNTCYDSTDINSQANSRQLKINGTVITGTMTANRTYGAAKGVNSIIPAEIVNYDATLYLWGANESDVTNTAKITTTYSRELSPRY